MIIASLQNRNTANRLATLRDRAEDVIIQGDFSGSVNGTWVKLGDSGEGLVKYKSKTYATQPIGFTSIPKGTEVELSYANGIYYSKF